MSDTPRTDKDTHRYENASVEWIGEWVPACACRIIERELNAANQRIQRLEEAGDTMASAYRQICYDPYDDQQIDNWLKAKKEKP